MMLHTHEGISSSLIVSTKQKRPRFEVKTPFLGLFSCDCFAIYTNRDFCESVKTCKKVVVFAII